MAKRDLKAGEILDMTAAAESKETTKTDTDKVEQGREALDERIGE